MTRVSLAIWAALSCATLAPAAFAKEPPADGITGEVSVSGSRTTGNTDTTDIGGALDLALRTGEWRQNFTATADYGEADDVETKSRLRLGYQLDRDINERVYVYGNANYFLDDFGPYKNGVFLGGGVGYHVALPEPLLWDLEAGPGYRRQKTREPVNAGPPSTIEDELALRARSNVEYDFNANVSAFNRTEIITSSSNTYVWNDVGVTATLLGNLAVRASFRVDYNTDVPEQRENTDTITRLGIVYTLD